MYFKEYAYNLRHFFEERREKIEIHLYILLRTCLLTIPLHRFFSVIVPNLLSRLPATKVKRNFNTPHKKILLQEIKSSSRGEEFFKTE